MKAIAVPSVSQAGIIDKIPILEYSVMECHCIMDINILLNLLELLDLLVFDAQLFPYRIKLSHHRIIEIIQLLNSELEYLSLLFKLCLVGFAIGCFNLISILCIPILFILNRYKSQENNKDNQPKMLFNELYYYT